MYVCLLTEKTEFFTKSNDAVVSISGLTAKRESDKMEGDLCHNLL